MPEQQNENNTENELSTEVLIPREQYEQLLSLLQEYRTDILTMVETFQAITSLFSGKTNALAMVPTIMKLIQDPKQLDRFKHIVPVIEKYLPKQSPENDQS